MWFHLAWSIVFHKQLFILLIVENDRSLTEAGNTIKSQMGNNAHLGKENALRTSSWVISFWQVFLGINYDILPRHLFFQAVDTFFDPYLQGIPITNFKVHGFFLFLGSEGSAESDLLVNCCTNLRDQMHHLFSCPSMCRKSDLQLGFELVQQIVIASWGSKILGDLTWGCQILGEL